MSKEKICGHCEHYKEDFGEAICCCPVPLYVEYQEGHCNVTYTDLADGCYCYKESL